MERNELEREAIASDVPGQGCLPRRPVADQRQQQSLHACGVGQVTKESSKQQQMRHVSREDKHTQFTHFNTVNKIHRHTRGPTKLATPEYNFIIVRHAKVAHLNLGQVQTYLSRLGTHPNICVHSHWFEKRLQNIFTTF